MKLLQIVLASYAYQCSKNSADFAIVNNKGETSLQFLHDLIGWIRAPVAKCPVGFDQKHGLVCAL